MEAYLLLITRIVFLHLLHSLLGFQLLTNRPLLTSSLQPPGTHGQNRVIPCAGRGRAGVLAPGDPGPRGAAGLLTGALSKRLSRELSGKLPTPRALPMPAPSRPAGTDPSPPLPTRGAGGCARPPRVCPSVRPCRVFPHRLAAARRFGAGQQMAAPPRLGAEPRARRCRASPAPVTTLPRPRPPRRCLPPRHLPACHYHAGEPPWRTAGHACPPPPPFRAGPPACRCSCCCRRCCWAPPPPRCAARSPAVARAPEP